MVRTRDFILGLLAVAFLVLAIGITQMREIVTSIGVVSDLVLSDSSTDAEYSAEVPVLPDTRADKLEHLRKKIAERLSLNDPEDEVGAVVVPSDTGVTATTTEVANQTVDECPGYQALSVAWSPATISQENREGMRMYSEVGQPVMDETGVMVASEIIRVQFPLRSWPLSNTSCIPYDVIGIATDGSLMRNSEVALYAVFGARTLVGYALDGFPIYGANGGVQSDACGGAIVEGTYRYILDADRAGIILCYAGVPATIQ